MKAKIRKICFRSKNLRAGMDFFARMLRLCGWALGRSEPSSGASAPLGYCLATEPHRGGALRFAEALSGAFVAHGFGGVIYN